MRESSPVPTNSSRDEAVAGSHLDQGRVGSALKGQTAPPPLLQVNQLAKHFGRRSILQVRRAVAPVRAVDGVTFTIGVGETLGLVGESGCGKTTTARLVLLLEEPTFGSIYFASEDIHSLQGARLKAYRTRVQAVFQDPWSSLSPRMRVRDIIAEPVVINRRIGAKEQSELVSHLLAEVGLPAAAAGDLPHEFSGGQRQRIAVARALAPDSRLIVLDEPVSALDVSIRAQIMNLLKDLQHERGVSYLLIAHNLATVRYLCHQTAVMYLGRIVEQAPSDQLFDVPLHPYTGALISASSMALDDDDHNRVVLQGEVPSPANPPAGCHFHPRCPLRNRLGRPRACEESEPELREVSPNHLVACHFAEEMGSDRNPPMSAAQ